MNEALTAKEEKAKWYLEREYGFEDIWEVWRYIRYLEGIKEDYEQLKNRVQALANYKDSLY